MKEFFKTKSNISYWRFEVVIEKPGKDLLWSAIDFRINHPPANGSCGINRLTGNTGTLFTLFCMGWDDEYGISKYVTYGM